MGIQKHLTWDWPFDRWNIFISILSLCSLRIQVTSLEESCLKSGSRIILLP